MAGLSVRVKSHTRELLERLADKVPAALEECGLVAEGYAKRLCPVDTGNLRNSITHTTEGNTVYVGTNVEYAPYVEMGTTRTHAQPFIKPAMADHVDQYKKILRRHLK